MLTRTRSISAGAAATLGVCFVVGCALIAAATFARADSTPRRLYRPTHIGVATTDLVVLSSTGTGSSLKFVQVRPDGTIDSTEYAVPSGYRLIVTDVEWAGQQPFAPCSTLRVFVENKTTTTTRNVVYMSTNFFKTDNGIGSFNPCGEQTGTLTGFSVSAAGRLVADVTATNSPTASYPAVNGTFQFSGLIILRGYVVPDA